jgi:hypothetical protein
VVETDKGYCADDEQREAMKGIKPRPLDQEELNSLESDEAVDYVALAAAEQFWREAVKNIPAVSSADMCIFCGNYGFQFHEPDCPWYLAQGY